MILYYALGGGLGHLSRAFTLISRAPEPIRRRVRLLVSSAHAALAAPHAPCPMDRIPERVMAERRLYGPFLGNYLARHGFGCIVVDSFPFGLLGELKHLAPTIPRLLVGRYLRWDAYGERCGSLADAVWPMISFLIEEQEETYRQELERNGRIIHAPAPLSLVAEAEHDTPHPAPACCVVHSGPRDEVAELLAMASEVMTARNISGAPELFTPQRGHYPVEQVLPRFSDVVAGAGYNACAAAAVLQGQVRFHLRPFPRRFDNQTRRLERLRSGAWGGGPGNAHTTATLLWDEVENMTAE